MRASGWVFGAFVLGAAGAVFGCGESAGDEGDADDTGLDGAASGGTTGGDGGDEGPGGAAPGSGGGSGGDAGAPLPTKPSLGCGEAAPAEGERSLDVAGSERTFLVSLPDDYDPEHAYPLVFAFHGRGNDGAGVSGPWYFGIEQKGGEPSIFVYPDGLDAGDGTGWANTDGRDVAFFDAMWAEMRSSYCVDENRVFSTGHSYGGMMSFTLACERAEVLRAVAPVAGANWGSGACSGPIAAWGAHGDPDSVVSYDLGVAAMARILETNGCDTEQTTPSGPEGSCLSYACDAGYPVTWCPHDEDHDWPEFAAQSIKDFFDSF